MMTLSEPGAHILVFPYPAQGHMLPLLDLTHQLALRNLTITILVTPKNLHYLNPLLSKHPASIHPLVLPFPANSALPAGVENVRDLPSTGADSHSQYWGDGPPTKFSPAGKFFWSNIGCPH